MSSGIYKLTFPNGQFYIGSSCNAERRIKKHIRLLLKNCHPNPKMQNSFNKTPGEIIGIIVLFCEENELILHEQKLMDLLQPKLNLSMIAGKVEWTNELRAKFSETKKGSIPWNKGLKDPEHSERMKGNTYTKGRKAPWVSATLKGRKRPEHSEFMKGNQYAKGIKQSDEQKAKQSESVKKRVRNQYGPLTL